MQTQDKSRKLHEDQFEMIVQDLIQTEKTILTLESFLDEYEAQDKKIAFDQSESLYKTINQLIINKDFDSAIKECESNLQNDPKLEKIRLLYLKILNNQVRSYLIDGEWKSIIPVCEKLISIGNRLDTYHYIRAIAYYNIDKKNKALKDLESVISINPNSDPAYITTGLIYISLSKIDEAIEKLEKAISINPKNDCPYWLLGLLYIHLEKDEDSLKSLNKAIELNQNNNIVNFLLVLTYLLLKKKREALRAFKNVKIDQIITKEIHNTFGGMLHQPILFDKNFEERMAVLIMGILSSIVR